jgi:hypothetical protein
VEEVFEVTFPDSTDSADPGAESPAEHLQIQFKGTYCRWLQEIKPDGRINF